MKKMSKLLALVLTLVMALSLVNTAFAAGTTGGTIVIEGTSTTLGYTVYKMFDIEKVSGKYKYRVPTEWGAFADWPGVDTFFVVKDHYVIWKKDGAVSASDGAAIAQLAREYLIGKSIAPVGSTDSDPVNVGESLSVTDDGYYLLVPNDKTASGVVVVEGGATETVKEKTAAKDLPVVEKKVQEDSNLTYQDTNDADIGQTINFRTTITAGAAAVNYVLHDKMDEHDGHSHLELIEVLEVKRGGNTVLPGADTYEVDKNPTDGCTFHVVFKEKFCKELHNLAQIIVTYTGRLTEEAAVDTEHRNEAWLTHTETGTVETNHVFTSTKTYQVKVDKKDQDEQPLAGAGFVLKDNVGMYYKWVDADSTDPTSYAHVEWVPNWSDATILETTVENGCSVVFKGVDAEIFSLEEKVVPGGYTGKTNVEADVKTPAASITVEVKNILGTQLPETGGMGTTLFYVGGGLLVAAAVVLLALKKRKAE